MTTQLADPKPDDAKLSPAFHESMFRLGDPAAPALQGIRPSKIADQLEAYETLYSKELAQFPSVGLVRKAVAWLFGFNHWQASLLITRMELKELALAHATVLNNEVAKAAQDDLSAQYIKIGGDLNDLHHFLIEHFKNETIQGIDLKKSLFQIVKELLLEKK